MDAATIHVELESLASEQIARMYSRSPSNGKAMGVKMCDMGKIAGRIRKNTALAWEMCEFSHAIEMRHPAIGAMDPAEVTED